DGTVARPDTVDELLEALAEPAWRAIEKQWQRGEIDSRECMARQIPLLRGGWNAIAQFLDERVVVHASFAPFARWCARRGLALRPGHCRTEQIRCIPFERCDTGRAVIGRHLAEPSFAVAERSRGAAELAESHEP